MDPEQNPLIPPARPNNMMPPPMQFPNPFAPPGPPPPPSPALGFQVWASDPMNALKVQHTMVAPDAPLQPNAPQNQGGSGQPDPTASAVGPRQPQMSSVNPPQIQSPIMPPGFQAPNAAIAAQKAGPGPAPAAASLPDSSGTPPVTNWATPPPRVQSGAQAQLGTDTAELQRLQNNGAGANQIKNPFLRALAKVGDVAGTVLSPGVMMAVPGTTMHNRVLQKWQGERVGQDRAVIDNQQQQQTNTANLAHTQAETAAIPINAGFKQTQAMSQMAQHGLKLIPGAEGGPPQVVADEDSPAYQKQQLEQDLIKAHASSFNAGVELKNAQTAFDKAKVDPTSALFKQTAQRLATAQSNAGAAQQRAQAYMGNYLQHSRNVDLDGNTLPGAPIIANDEGDQTVVGSTNASTAVKNQSNAAQFNDVHGALDSLEGSARALIAKGGKLNSPGVAAALAQPEGTLGQWLQGAGVKANLTPEERAYVQSVAAAHENVQALRKSAGGTATDSAVAKLDSMIPGASTPDLNYLLGQTGQIRSTAERLGKGATVASGGLTVRGQGNPMKPPAVPAKTSYAQTATGPNNHRIGSNDGGKTWFDVKTGKAVQ